MISGIIAGVLLGLVCGLVRQETPPVDRRHVAYDYAGQDRPSCGADCLRRPSCNFIVKGAEGAAPKAVRAPDQAQCSRRSNTQPMHSMRPLANQTPAAGWT